MNLERRCPRATFAHPPYWAQSVHRRPGVALETLFKTLTQTLQSFTRFSPPACAESELTLRRRKSVDERAQCNIRGLDLEELISPHQMPFSIRAVDTDDAL